MALEGLEGKPWYFGLVLGLVFTGALGFLGYMVVVKEMWKTQQDQEVEMKELEDKIVRGQTAMAKLPQVREEVALLDSELEKLLLILPPQRDVPSVLRRFRALAEQGDFVLNRFAPGIEVEKDFYNEWPIQVELQGTYHNLARFFDRMSRFSRIFNIDNLKIEQQRENQHSVSATFVAKTFVLKEASVGEEEELR